MSTVAGPSAPPPGPRRYVPAVGPRLRKVLYVVFGLFAVLGVNAVYLVSITILEWVQGATYQNYFYQVMFLMHLALGVLLILPVVLFGFAHIYNAYNRPNRRAVRAGLALFGVSLALLVSGVLLMRLDFFEIKNPNVRSAFYWVHVLSPLVVVWLFVLHRLAGRRIRWKVGLVWAGVAGAFAIAMAMLHSQDPRRWNIVGPKSGEQYFFPSLARTASGNFIPARTLMMDDYCIECHPDIHKAWSHSVHRFSSFNNPPYLFSVRETRKVALERDGSVQASRFCAGCHDVVPFFSGAFDNPNFDDVNDPTAKAGITCTSCHAITNINSTRGNADYTIDEPIHYPFAFSTNPVLHWINKQLVKGKPAFHKKTFLKPLHRTAEFCATCHKVHLPEELNHYRWLRGQNHYDPYLLSGVSGHGVQSFYYPPKATHTCAACHMPLNESHDFGAKFYDDSGVLKVHNHQFPSANTAIPYLVGMPPEVIEAHREFNDGVMRVDIFGVKDGGGIDGTLSAPLRPQVPALRPGEAYLLETVIRTVKMGHLFTQGTVDSNEVWMDVKITSGERVIGRSGGMRDADREVDPWSHFVNVFVLDRDGNRIDRRNAQDIFVPLYNNQIPPGAGDVVHYRFVVPPDVREPIAVEVNLRYRKFDTTYMKQFQGDKFRTNDLPILTLATDRVVFPVEGGPPAPANEDSKIPVWQRWNDYGIGLLRKGDSGSDKGELRQAEAAFREVEKLGRADGPLNCARVYIKEGRLDEAVTALQAAAAHKPPAPAWSVAWFSGLVNKQNGYFDEAIADFRRVLAMKDTPECREREFDFSLDYTLLDEYGQTLFERAKREREPARQAERTRLLTEAVSVFQRVLKIDSENASAHYNLSLLFGQLGDADKAKEHLAKYNKYKVDDNARDRAIVAARLKYPAANHAAEAIVIYDLQRDGAYGLPSTPKVALHE